MCEIPPNYIAEMHVLFIIGQQHGHYGYYQQENPAQEV